jgi:hypothetical protein
VGTVTYDRGDCMVGTGGTMSSSDFTYSESSNSMIAVAIFLQILSHQVAADKPPTTICELFKDLRSSANKVVHIEGFLMLSSELSGLLDTRCSDHFITDGYTWPTALTLNVDSRPQAYQQIAALPHPRIGAVYYRVQIKGVLRMRKEYILVNVRGRITSNGFGHLGLYPAELDVEGFRLLSGTALDKIP